MVGVVQLVRASDCGSECRGFESHRPPSKKQAEIQAYEGFPLFFYGMMKTEWLLQVAFKHYKWIKNID